MRGSGYASQHCRHFSCDHAAEVLARTRREITPNSQFPTPIRTTPRPQLRRFDTQRSAFTSPKHDIPEAAPLAQKHGQDVAALGRSQNPDIHGFRANSGHAQNSVLSGRLDRAHRGAQVSDEPSARCMSRCCALLAHDCLAAPRGAALAIAAAHEYARACAEHPAQPPRSAVIHGGRACIPRRAAHDRRTGVRRLRPRLAHDLWCSPVPRFEQLPQLTHPRRNSSVTRCAMNTSETRCVTCEVS